jgi:hypothetical protein
MKGRVLLPVVEHQRSQPQKRLARDVLVEFELEPWLDSRTGSTASRPDPDVVGDPPSPLDIAGVIDVFIRRRAQRVQIPGVDVDPDLVQRPVVEQLVGRQGLRGRRPGSQDGGRKDDEDEPFAHRRYNTNCSRMTRLQTPS